MKAVDILPGSCTKGLSENVVVRGETSYQMLEVLSFGDRERAQYPYNNNKNNNRVLRSGKKK